MELSDVIKWNVNKWFSADGETAAWSPAVPRPSCVSLGKLVSTSGPPFTHLWNGKTTLFVGLLWRLSVSKVVSNPQQHPICILTLGTPPSKDSAPGPQSPRMAGSCQSLFLWWGLRQHCPRLLLLLWEERVGRNFLRPDMWKSEGRGLTLLRKLNKKWKVLPMGGLTLWFSQYWLGPF